MELEIGMCVRTINGKIWIIKSQQAISGHRKDIINASYDIIDLIEVGDYVNGYKVSFVDEEPVMGKFVQCDYEVSFGTTNHYRFYEADIKSIVTHEQFESMEYKVEE